MNEEIKTSRVWDLPTRIFHWSLAASFSIAFLTSDSEKLRDIHVIAGYSLAGLIAFRLLWGFVGGKHSRFADFLPTRQKLIDYFKSLLIGKPRHYVGHNPAGGAMIVLLLLSLVLTTLTGLGAYGAEGYGPLAGWAAGLVGLGREAMEEVHEFAANFTLFLILVHIAGVLFGSLLHRENLVRAMITGRKPAKEGEANV